MNGLPIIFFLQTRQTGRLPNSWDRSPFGYRIEAFWLFPERDPGTQQGAGQVPGRNENRDGPGYGPSTGYITGPVPSVKLAQIPDDILLVELL